VGLLICIGASTAFADDFGDLRVPLQIKSRFVVRPIEGPPADRAGLNRYAPIYIFKFNALKYARSFSFTDKGRFIRIQDHYGNYELPISQTLRRETYLGYRSQYAVNDSWKGDLKQELGKKNTEQDGGEVEFKIPWEAPKAVTSIIGEGRSSIRVSGSRSITFSGRSEWEDGLKNTGTFKQSKFPTLQMEQISRFKVTGSIGSKITVEVDQDSKRDVELANTIKLRYKGEEDEILQSIEAGNTNLSLPNAQLIGYSQNVQGLFGIKATAKVGNFDLTMITSQEKGTSEKANFNAGASGREELIRDWEYLPYAYFWLDDLPHSVEDTLVSVELYTVGTPTDPYGIAILDPATDDRGEYEYGNFKYLDQDEFDIYPTGWFISLDKPLLESEVLGAYVIYTRYNPDLDRSDTIRVGSLSYRPSDAGADTTLLLKLLKPRTVRPGGVTWERAWKNVYDLGSRNISSDGFDLKIYRGTGDNNRVGINDVEDQNGHCYVTLLGLDRRNNTTQAAGADCVFDFDNTMIDGVKGHLIFPHRYPFDSDSLDERVPQIYRSTFNNRDDTTVYFIYVKTAQRASTFPLGRANIMPNSEVVKLGDGTILKRDVDYSINYDIGQITFISDQALNPAANVTVDFEYAPFFMPEKKSLFGLAGEYHLWENSSISMAAMYRSETASDPRPRVGREPRRGLVWDSNFNLGFQPDFMTDLVDALPLIEADAQSSLNISGEVAQSFPNPNVKGEAFIDDFEGVKNYTDLSTRRSIWTISSAPLDSMGTTLPLTSRGRMWWYNPNTPLAITQIWPNRRENVKQQEDRIDILVMNMEPDTSLPQPEASWGGIMRSLYTGLADQSKSKFLEMWYYPDTFSASVDPILTIDLGYISEDLNNDRFLNSEDRRTVGTAWGIFEPDEEDTGLDTLFDTEGETGPYAPPDRAGDNWHWNPDSSYIDYRRINGTEGNANDPDRRGRFDTEDISNNNALDYNNGYFSYSIHLDNPQFLADSTTTGWKLLRIPLRDSTIYQMLGDSTLANFTSINYARLWLTGCSEPYQLAIATLELVGNKWQELEIAIPEGDVLRPDEKFEIAVKNTQDNANYEPPPGVAGNLNRDTGIREKEQSLVLAYQNMAAAHVGGAAWKLYESEDYTQYGKLKMYVHGDSSAASGIPDGRVTFFMRMSSDYNATSFYEYHTALQPGWARGNWVEIDFARLTELKYELQSRVVPESLGIADTTDGNYRIHGNPALSQVLWYIVGVEIAGDAPGMYTGEVWIDEMRVDDIRRNSDYAGRVQVNARFADFIDAGGSYSRQGADFFPLSARVPVGSTTINKTARLGVKADKLLPPSLGLSLPVTVSWQNSLQLPRLKPGSDIILDRSAQEVEKTTNTTYSYTVSQGFARNTKNWLWNLTLNRIKTGYTFSRSDGISPSSPINRRDTYKGTAAYDLSPKAKPSFKPLAWTKYLFLPKSIRNSSLTPLPTQLTFSGEVNGSKSLTVNQRRIQTGAYTRDLMLSGTTAISPFSTLRSSYNITATRDISRPGRFRLSIDPSKLRLGQEQTLQQRFETSYQPRILKFVDNRFSFNSSYSENADIRRNPDSTRTTQMSSTFKTDVTFNIQNLLPRSGGGGGGQPRRDEPPEMMPGEQERPDDLDQKGPEEPEEKRPEGTVDRGPSQGFVGRVFSLLRTIKPVRGSYIKDKKFGLQGLLERPSWKYMFGFIENPRVRAKSSSGLTSTNQTVFSDNYQVESGLNPGGGLDISSSYGLRKTVTRSSTNPVSTRSETFPDINVSLARLEKLFLFRKFSNTVGLQSSYSKKVDVSGRADTGELHRRETSRDWAPLASINIDFKNSVRTTLRYNSNKTYQENLKPQGQSLRDTETLRKSIELSIQYSLTAPQGLKLPLLRRVKFNSQLSLNLTISVTGNRTTSVDAGVRSVEANTSQIAFAPSVTYQFSRAITGSIRGRWEDSNNKILKRKHHVRELGISAEIRF
jgi:cell surface protein SprA